MTVALETERLLAPEMCVRYIVMHHSLTPDGRAKDWDAIRRYHVETNGWRDIGYHFGVELDGAEYVVRTGRPVPFKGAHVGDGDFNLKSIGVCVVGNFDAAPVPVEQWDLARLLVRRLRNALGVPAAMVLGHREAQFAAGVQPAGRKSCPGRLFDMEAFRAGI